MKNPITLTVCLLLFSFPAFAQCDTDAHRQFDFWIGEWDVYHATADTLVGRNSIKKILNGCVIEESWTGATGFQGKSFNTYHPRDSTWNQVWVDQGGATYHFSGRFQDNVMQFHGETIGRDGAEVLFDFSFTYDPASDTVRQTWKASRDHGENWRTIFDGLYRRRQ